MGCAVESSWFVGCCSGERTAGSDWLLYGGLKITEEEPEYRRCSEKKRDSHGCSDGGRLFLVCHSVHSHWAAFWMKKWSVVRWHWNIVPLRFLLWPNFYFYLFFCYQAAPNVQIHRSSSPPFPSTTLHHTHTHIPSDFFFPIELWQHLLVVFVVGYRLCTVVGRVGAETSKHASGRREAPSLRIYISRSLSFLSSPQQKIHRFSQPTST